MIDASYETYNARAAAAVAALNREGSTKSAELAEELTGLIGSESPRLISTTHRAEALTKFSARELRDALGRWTDGGAAAAVVNGPPLTGGLHKPKPSALARREPKKVNTQVSMAFTQVEDAITAAHGPNPFAPGAKPTGTHLDHFPESLAEQPASRLHHALAGAREKVDAALAPDAPVGAVSRALTALRNFESDAKDEGLHQSHPDQMANLNIIREQLRAAARR
jgi:hypothetical protein